MDLKEMIKVMQHFADGGEILYKAKKDDSNNWIKCTSPIWNWFKSDYKIKEPKLKIEKWLCQDRQDDFLVVETSNIDKYVLHKKIKLLETYEVEL